MKPGFRQAMGWLHTWTGLIVGWVLFLVFLTGTAGYFDAEIDRWMQPERPLSTVRVDTATAIAVAVERLRVEAPDAERWFIELPGPRLPDLTIFARTATDGAVTVLPRRALDPTTGGVPGWRQTGGGQFLYQLHYRLHYLPVNAAYWLVGLCSFLMLLAILAGIIVHKRVFTDLFTFRPGSGQRAWLDAHNLLAVPALPFHLMITWSGLLFFGYLYMAPVVAAAYGPGPEGRQLYFDESLGYAGAPPRSGRPAELAPVKPMLAELTRRWGADRVWYLFVWNPGDATARVEFRRIRDTPVRTADALVFDGVSGDLLGAPAEPSSLPKTVHDVLLGLHEGLFAGPMLRWLYFLSGVMGAAMIGAGLVLWTTKRRARIGETIGFKLVERLNVGTIAGLPVAVAAYFWANRLIPVGLGGRAAWEANAMFIAWAVLLAHAFVRPPRRSWVEQLWLAAGACGLLPVLNALTTDRHLGVTLPAGAWDLAGFDLTMFGFGLAFALAAWRAGRRALVVAGGQGQSAEASAA